MANDWPENLLLGDFLLSFRYAGCQLGDGNANIRRPHLHIAVDFLDAELLNEEQRLLANAPELIRLLFVRCILDVASLLSLHNRLYFAKLFPKVFRVKSYHQDVVVLLKLVKTLLLHDKVHHILVHQLQAPDVQLLLQELLYAPRQFAQIFEARGHNLELFWQLGELQRDLCSDS